MDDVIVSSKVLANVLKLTERRLLQLVQEGMPKSDKGSYPLVACVHFYIDFLNSKVGNHSQTLGQEKLKLMREKAERAALENQKLRNKVIDIDGITQQVMDLMQRLRDGLMAIPGRLCNELVGKTNVEIRQALDMEIKQVLNGIAEKLETMADDTQSENVNDTKQESSEIPIESSSGSLANEMVQQRG